MEMLQNVKAGTLTESILKVKGGKMTWQQLDEDRYVFLYHRIQNGTCEKKGLFLFEDEWESLMKKRGAITIMMSSVDTSATRPVWRNESLKRKLSYEDSDDDDDNDDDDDDDDNDGVKGTKIPHSDFGPGGSTCYGCEMERPSQLDHMGLGGCMADN